MPAIKPTDYTQDYHRLNETRKQLRDNNACGVIAIAAVTGASYEEVYKLFEKHGRKHRRGVYHHQEMAVLKELGFKKVRVNLENIIRSYPLPHCNVLKNVTTHHPRRFPGCFPKGKLLGWTRGHIVAIVDGNVVDWSINYALRLYSLHEIVPIGDNPKTEAEVLANL